MPLSYCARGPSLHELFVHQINFKRSHNMDEKTYIIFRGPNGIRSFSLK